MSNEKHKVLCLHLQKHRKMSKRKSEKTLEIIRAAEEIADKVLVNKQELVQLDEKRQLSREALRETEEPREPSKKVWISIGSMLVKVRRDSAIKMLKDDLKKIESDIDRINTEQKLLIYKHRDLEYLSPQLGANIKPLDHKVFEALRSA